MRVATLLAAGLVVVSCGSDADPVELVVEPAVTQVEQGLDAVDDARALACDADRRSLEQAIESYTLLEGEPPTDESVLVPDWLREESELFDIVDGVVTPTPESPCS